MPVMQEAIDILKGFDIETEVDIVSCNRTPENYLILVTHKAWYLSNNCGAGGAALPGMVASCRHSCYWSSCKI
jgi:5-(carboxyamino)imidazole ribonucleotide mutase